MSLWLPAQYNDTEEFRNSQVASTDIYSADGFERRLFEATKLYEGHGPEDQIYPYWNVWFDPEDASELATLQTNIEDFVTQSSLQFVTGQNDINSDAAWNACLQSLEELGLPRYWNSTSRPTKLHRDKTERRIHADSSPHPLDHAGARIP